MSRVVRTAPVLGSVLGLYLLSGCADLQDNVEDLVGDQDNEPRTLAFVCDDDREFAARLSDDRDRAWLDVGSETYELEYTGRENGMRVYGDDDDEVRLTVGDDEAYLRIPGGSDFKNCEQS